MAYINMFEVLKRNQKWMGKQKSYSLMAYSNGTAPKYLKDRIPGVFSLYFTKELLEKARMKQGDSVTMDYEPTTKEAVIRLDPERGERRISLAGTRKQGVTTCKVTYPMYGDYGFPRVDMITSLDKSVHTKAGVITFSLNFNGDKRKA